MAKKSGDVIFVNDDKYKRAVDLVALATGARSIRKATEGDVQSFWANSLAEADLTKAHTDDQILHVYNALGGLTRTPAEEAKAQQTKKEMTAALRKKKAGGKK